MFHSFTLPVRHFLILVLFCAGYRATAQLPLGSVAPDFTLTDINGQNFNLYNDALNQGKYVFIDFFATWCGPCWDDYEEGVTQYVEANFGPNALCGEQVVTLAIEADLETNSADLEGWGNNTQGNWTSNNSYRIFDLNSSALINSYDVVQFPQYYLICPDGQVYYQSFFYLGGMSIAGLDCGYGNDVAVNTMMEGDCASNTFTGEIQVENINIPSLNAMTIVYALDGGEELTLPWTVNVGMGQSTTVVLPPLAVDPGAHELLFRVEMPNGAPDQHSLNNCKKFSFNAIENFPYVGFMETFSDGALPDDDWLIVGFLNDLDWQYSNVNGGCVMMPGYEAFETVNYDIYMWTYMIGLDGLDTPYFTMDYAYAPFSTQASLADGIRVEIVSTCQEEVIFDLAGMDLATAPITTSSFVPTSEQWATFCYDLSAFAYQNISIRIYGDYEFGNNIYLDNIGIVTADCTIGIDNIENNETLVLYPNPAQNNLSVKWPESFGQSATITIWNMEGRIVHRETNTPLQSGSIDCAQWTNGIYLIEVQTDQHTLRNKVSVMH